MIDGPCPTVIRVLLDYNPSNGDLRWRKRTSAFFSATDRFGAEYLCRRWNTRYAGTFALSAKLRTGHLTGTVLGARVAAHRVAWCHYYGYWPDQIIDHKNRNPRDNSIGNLRLVDPSLNAKNRKTRSDNTSGVTGVRWHEATSKWAATISLNRKAIHLGVYSTIEEAVEARRKAMKNAGYYQDPS